MGGRLKAHCSLAPHFFSHFPPHTLSYINVSPTEASSAPSKTFNPPLAAGVQVESLCIPALEDEWALGALRFTHAACEEVQASTGKLGAAVVIAPATGVPARFYSHFAAWLASNGHPTTIFDYRMNGASYPSLADISAVPKGKNNDSARFTPDQRVECLRAHKGVGWSEYCGRDVPAVLLAAREHAGPASKRELCYMGNSLGCHCLPASLAKLEAIGADPEVDCKRALFIARNSSYVKFNLDLDFQRHYSAVLSKEEGFGTTSRFSMGNDIPAGALRDWMYRAQHKTYITDKQGFEQSFKIFNVPTLTVGFSDIIWPLVSPRIIDGYCRTLGNPTSVETEEERAYWLGPHAEEPDHVGLEAWRRGPPPHDTKRASNSFTNARLFLDVVRAHGWVRNSPHSPPNSNSKAQDGKDAPSKVIVHRDLARFAVWQNGEAPSAKAWNVLREWAM